MFRTRILAAALALLLLGGAPHAIAQQLVRTPPEARSFRLGALHLAALRDSGLAVANDASVFGLNAGSAATAKVLAAAGAPTATIRLDVDALLVRTAGHVVLIDTGFGPPGHGVLIRSLALAGVAPDEVTDVLITHAHTDHVGGLLDAQGRSAFPKAVIRMSANEWAFLQRQRETAAMARTIARQVRTFQPGRPILPGITPVALYGHTPGHVGYEIASGGRTLFDIGDTAHSSIVSLARPDWLNDFDVDRSAGAAQRRATLQRLAASHRLIFAPHFAFPGVGRIVPAGAGFAFRPELPR